MTVANTAWDLQAYSKGRFVLGLGSQIKPHIEKRFSMEWSKPAARMREFALAMRAIWNTWLTGEKLEFRGEFYQHTLMTPMFSPDKRELDGFGPPKMFLAGVGPLMTEVAGEAFDGFICHGFTTEKYLREVTIPALAGSREGGEDDGRVRDCRAHRSSSRATTTKKSRRLRSPLASRSRSTVPHRRIAQSRHAWLGRAPRRAEHTVQAGRMGQNGHAYRRRDPRIRSLSSASQRRSPVNLAARYGDVIQRLSFYAPYASNPDRWAKVMSDLKAA